MFLFFKIKDKYVNAKKKIEKIVACSMSRQEVLTVKLKIMGVAELIYTKIFTKGRFF